MCLRYALMIGWLSLTTSCYARTENLVDFDAQIRPLWRAHCLHCHGPEKQESNFRLDRRATVLAGGDFGEPTVVPGNSAASPLIRYVSDSTSALVMPPVGEGERLSESEIGLLRRWIDEGATMSETSVGDVPAGASTLDHWAFQPLKASVPRTSSDWIANAIDAFIVDRLSTEGLEPSVRADRVTLMRRIYLDLLGVPPTYDAVQHFVNDRRVDAYDRLVDEVLSHPQLGERWAQHWLDVVRYGESDGFETNRERPAAYHYRDYVVHAFNSDKPYDRFVTEQIAGDAYANGIATGFLVAGTHDRVGGPDINLRLIQRQNELTDIANTTATTFLGLTVGCARCHNHKFDPISQAEFYSIQAVFAGIQHDKLDSDPNSDRGYSAVFTDPPKTYRLHRGDPAAIREEVAPNTLSILSNLELGIECADQERRVAFADSITDRRNPLTARVIVNRVWQNHFGRGLVATPSDFGQQGIPPTHPELLDFLAQYLIEHDWSLKQVHRLILLSNCYQQSDRPRPECLAKDADGQLHWRYSPRRLDAEAIRDSILSVSGNLDVRMGGHGFYALHVIRENVHHYEAKDEFDASDWRRMLYAVKIRQERDGEFGAFDCPDGGQIVPQRSRSTTPLQAMNLLNSRFMLLQAEAFAARLQQAAPTELKKQVRLAFQTALGRTPDPAELEMSHAFMKEHGQLSFCRAFLNCSELLFIP